MANNDINIRLGVQGANQVAQDAKKAGDSFQGMNSKAERAAQGMSGIGRIVGMFNAEAGNAITMLSGMVMGFKNMARAAMAFIATPVGAAIAVISIAVAGLMAAFQSAKKRIREFREEMAFTRELRITSLKREMQEAFDAAGRSIDRATAKLQRFRELASARVNASRSLQDARMDYERTTAMSGARNDQDRALIGVNADYERGQVETRRAREDVARDMEKQDEVILLARKRKAQLEEKLEKQAAVEYRERQKLVDLDRVAKNQDEAGNSLAYTPGSYSEEERKSAAREAKRAREDYNSSYNTSSREAQTTRDEIGKAEEEIAHAYKMRGEIAKQNAAIDEREKANEASRNARIRDLEDAREAEMRRHYQDLKDRYRAQAQAELDSVERLEDIGADEGKRLDLARRRLERARINEEGASRRAAELDEVYQDPERWKKLTSAEQEKNRHDFNQAQADAETEAAKRRSLTEQVAQMERAVEEKARARNQQLDQVGRGSTSNRLTALGLYGGSVTPVRWQEQTARNTQETNALLRQNIEATKGLDTSARVQG